MRKSPFSSSSSVSPSSSPASVTRRHLMGGTLGSAMLPGLALAPRRAEAADYKALVCLFLYGGNDGMNMVVPTDDTRYSQYAAVRGSLAVPRGNLIPLSGLDYGLHPSMAALSGAWNEGALTPVFNVGPLARPLTKDEFRALPSTSTQIPSNLYSHSDQQTLWETSDITSLARTGWGGRAAQVLGTANPVISLSGGNRFSQSSLTGAMSLPPPGSGFELDGMSPRDVQWAPMAARKVALDGIYAAPQSNILLNAFVRQHQSAVQTANRLATLVRAQPGQPGSTAAVDQAFAPLTLNGKITTPLAQQLYQIAKLIASNTIVQGDRQIFFASLGGFDTHAGQYYNNGTMGHHADLLKVLADATAAFHQAMKNIGMGPQVTLFTESDFGRTFKPNSTNGTDHAWGNHHLVLGGGVRGKTAYGWYPTLALAGPNDVAAQTHDALGRWIPTSSVDQYAATLLRWFGASEGQLDTILPRLANFGGARSLGFL
ncbi:MAG: DUF1501 domain-containing protein [Pseudomonadota bacterium]